MRGGALLCVAMVFAGGSWAAAAPEGYFDLQPGVTLETGDTWIAEGKRYRLYGVQSCLRGTAYTERSGEKQDCGDASLAMLAAYIRDTSPVCAPVAASAGTTFVACYATIGGERLDLANILIASGFAFASLDAGGMPLHAPYAVVEQKARESRAGLWQFDDVQHPSILLSRAANERGRKGGQ
ncbi:endonuclease YncB(thermonuclease family) [Aminobacter lissarensis]|uniref:Endonuclease YncB(Thermonuclease family) n=1 Tax=Aminobacter carboxidus TaxID=376165 RepID=A0A8E1WJS9_9HYPH|nr:thermonuclease family protein [Aminobacter lissarensis]MBB6469169.1 endonuclease YncB(thermonuclease family) [Aminobacter lissarensis]